MATVVVMLMSSAKVSPTRRKLTTHQMPETSAMNAAQKVATFSQASAAGTSVGPTLAAMKRVMVMKRPMAIITKTTVTAQSAQWPVLYAAAADATDEERVATSVARRSP